MKQPSKDLFILIHSLSKTEKGYFKKFAQQHVMGEKNNYMLLFETIAKQKEYDETTIKKKFSKEIFVKQLTFTKLYLYDLILKSLRSYHHSRTVDTQLKQSIHNIGILYEKGLYDQCQKIIRTAHKLSSRYEKPLYQIQLFNWEMELIRAHSYAGSTQQDFTRIYESLCEQLDVCRNTAEYDYHTLCMFDHVNKKGFARSKDDIAQYKKIISQPAFQHPDKALSYSAKYNFYTVQCTYYFMLDRMNEAYHYAEQAVQLAESHPHRTAEKPKEMANVLNNLIVCQRSLGRYQQMLQTIGKLRNVATNSEGLSSRILHSCNIYELLVYIETGQFEKGVQLCNSFEKSHYSNEQPILFKKYTTELYFYISYVHFGAGNYTLANRYLNNILNAKDSELRSDLHYFARILSLVIHYELGNQDLLEYAVRSTYRFLYQSNKLYRFETAILDFIRTKMPKANSKKEVINAFIELKATIEKITSDPYEKKALELFDLISWLESKIKNQTFAGIVKAKKMER